MPTPYPHLNRKYARQRRERMGKAAYNQSMKEYYDNNLAVYLYNLAAARARRSGLVFTITRSDIVVPEVCPVLGIPLYRGERGKCDNAPSLDRVDNSLGYISDNVRVISRLANTIKGSATIEEMEAIIAYVRSQTACAE